MSLHGGTTHQPCSPVLRLLQSPSLIGITQEQMVIGRAIATVGKQILDLITAVSCHVLSSSPCSSYCHLLHAPSTLELLFLPPFPSRLLCPYDLFCSSFGNPPLPCGHVMGISRWSHAHSGQSLLMPECVHAGQLHGNTMFPFRHVFML